MKKVFKSIVIIIAILFLFDSVSFADTDFKKQIKAEDGSTFEKIIAGMIGGIAQTVFDFSTNDSIGVGFKDYDDLIFNKNNDELSPFTDELWSKTMKWYKIFSIVSESLILLATVILAYKIITAGNSVTRKKDAKESLLRLVLGGILIPMAPLFIKFLLFMNNGLIKVMMSSANNSIDGLLGESMITSIKTGNAITTAIVISMFIYLFVKLNIKFIIRQFTLIVFTIFTPFSVGLWIINKNSTAISIWVVQIIMNIFMQFVYCFLFLLYLTFLPAGNSWAVSLIWAMMILPISETLMNCFQNLTSRIAGMDNEEMTGRVMTMGGMAGYGIASIKEQFKTQKMSDNNSTEDSRLGNSFVSKVKNIINPTKNMSNVENYDEIEEDYMPKRKSLGSIAGKIASTGIKATGAYLNLGKELVEGKTSREKLNKYDKPNKNYMQNYSENSGEYDEFEEQSEDYYDE